MCRAVHSQDQHVSAHLRARDDEEHVTVEGATLWLTGLTGGAGLLNVDHGALSHA